jgi:hypothetical protein
MNCTIDDVACYIVTSSYLGEPKRRFRITPRLRIINFMLNLRLKVAHLNSGSSSTLGQFAKFYGRAHLVQINTFGPWDSPIKINGLIGRTLTCGRDQYFTRSLRPHREGSCCD